MNNKTFSSSTITLNQFKTAAKQDVPPTIDFSERVMEQITNETDQAINVQPLSKSRAIRKPIYIIAAIIIIIMVSGFGFTRYGWELALTDKMGNTVLKIHTAGGELPAGFDNITTKVRSSLEANDGAMIVFGQEAVEAAKSGEIPINYTTVTKGETFSAMQQLYPHLTGIMREVNLPNQINGSTFVEAELLYNVERKINPVASLWEEKIDQVSHVAYAFQPIEVTNEISSLISLYENGHTKYSLDISPRDQPTINYYTNKVSSSNVYKISGVEVYRNSHDGEETLLWNRPVNGGSLFYTLTSDSANIIKLKAFAKQLIRSYSSVK